MHNFVTVIVAVYDSDIGLAQTKCFLNRGDSFGVRQIYGHQFSRANKIVTNRAYILHCCIIYSMRSHFQI